MLNTFKYLSIEELLIASKSSSYWSNLIQIHIFDKITGTIQMKNRSIGLNQRILVEWILRCRKLTKFDFRHLKLQCLDNDVATILLPNFFEKCPSITIFRGINENTNDIALCYLNSLLVETGSCGQIVEYSSTLLKSLESTSPWLMDFDLKLKRLRFVINEESPWSTSHSGNDYQSIRGTVKNLYLKLHKTATKDKRKHNSDNWTNLCMAIIASIADAKLPHNSQKQLSILRQNKNSVIAADIDPDAEVRKICDFIRQLTSLTGFFDKRFLDHCIRSKCTINLTKFQQLNNISCELQVLKNMPYLTHLTIAAEDPDASILSPLQRWIEQHGPILISLKIALLPNHMLLEKISYNCYNLKKLCLLRNINDWVMHHADFRWYILAASLKNGFRKLNSLNITSDPPVKKRILKALRLAALNHQKLRITNEYFEPWYD